jgi:hypothetical protein
MKFACLVYFEAADMDALTPQQQQQLTDDALDYNDRLAAEGKLLVAQALHPPEKAVSVRVRNGKMSATDGPFAETREQLAGFMLIDAADMAEAIAIAGRDPMATIGTMEVRPFLELSHS